MYGAIIGDLAGSIYEYDQTKKVKNVKINNIIEDNSFYSDDTILTIAILDAIKNNCNYDYYLRKYINEYKDYKPDFKPYFKYPFSPNMVKWAKSSEIGTSIGNGAMMRISPIGYLFNNEDDIKTNARLATMPSHNSEEAINSATIVALLIYYFRNGLSKEEAFNRLNIVPSYKEFDKFNLTCSETINNCLYIIYNTNSFEEAIRSIIYLGGDTDTNACIVGSIAEALYGIDSELISKANSKLPDNFINVLKKVY